MINTYIKEIRSNLCEEGYGNILTYVDLKLECLLARIQESEEDIKHCEKVIEEIEDKVYLLEKES